MLQMIHRVIPFNSLINGLPKEGEEGIPKEIWLYKAHASSDFDIYNSPPGCKSCLSRQIRERTWEWVMSSLPSWTIPSGHLDKLLAPCKGSQNSLGFWIPCCEFQIPGTRFQIAYQWNLDSRLQPLVAFQIELYSGCQSPKSGFHKQKNPGFGILQLNLSWVPDSLTRGKVSNVPNSDLFFF